MAIEPLDQTEKMIEDLEVTLEALHRDCKELTALSHLQWRVYSGVMRTVNDEISQVSTRICDLRSGTNG